MEGVEGVEEVKEVQRDFKNSNGKKKSSCFQFGRLAVASFRGGTR